MAQPLAALTSYVGAGVRMLGDDPPAPAVDAINRGLGQVDRTRELLSRARGRPLTEHVEPYDLANGLVALATLTGLPPSCLPTPSVTSAAVSVPARSLETALFHLFTNAIEAADTVTEGRHAIRCALTQLDDTWEVAIHNPWPGGFQDEWLDPFFTTKPTHLGIGLLVARRICARIGAEVEADRCARDEVTFTITIPTS